MKKFSPVLIVLLIFTSLFSCNTIADINLASYNQSGNYAFLDIGEELTGQDRIAGFDSSDIIYSVKNVSTSEFIVRSSSSSMLGHKQYDLFQAKSLRLIPTQDFQIKNIFLFNHGQTSGSSDNEGHFTIYPKSDLSAEQRKTVIEDLSSGSLSYEYITKDIDWNSTSVYSIIDIGMTFHKHSSIFWYSNIIECNDIMYYSVTEHYSITDIENGEKHFYYKVNDDLASYIKKELDGYNYFS